MSPLLVLLLKGSGYYVGGIYIMNTQYDQKGRYTCRVETTNGDKYESWADIIINGKLLPLVSDSRRNLVTSNVFRF